MTSLISRSRVGLLLCALAGGCADRPLSILPGAPRDLAAPADLARTGLDEGVASANDLAAPADLGPIGAPAPPWSGDAVAYQIDPMHRGAQAGTLVPPLHQRWSSPTGGPTSYPLIANGRVFFIRQLAGNDVLVALDAATGASEWQAAVGVRGPAALAYDGGHVFTTTTSVISAFREDSGAMSWSAMVGSDASPPTASNGLVYYTAGNQVFALDAADGSTRWAESLLAGGGSSPIVSPAAVFLPLVCGQAWAFQPYDGSVLWHANPNCDGSGSVTGVLDDGNVYLRSPGMTNLILAASNGNTLTPFTSDRIPAFDDSGVGYFVSHSAAGGTMVAQDMTGATHWSFTGDGGIISAPLVVNHYVYVGSTSGALFAVDGSGVTKWSTNTGAAFGDPDQLAAIQPLPGLAAAESLLVVANAAGLIAYGQ